MSNPYYDLIHEVCAENCVLMGLLGIASMPAVTQVASISARRQSPQEIMDAYHELDERNLELRQAVTHRIPGIDLSQLFSGFLSNAVPSVTH